ncbi:SH3 domain-containing protein [bacterium]|nr:SH3 domain-containing protein [bacterium]
MSEIDLYHAYERFKLPPDADQEEIRRVYVQLRQELDGEDLRTLYTAWDNLLSPQNRVRVDALLLQAERAALSIDELLAEVAPAADVADWNSFIDQAALLQRETEMVTSLILEHTWLGHAYSTLFRREAPVPEQWPLPQVTLTPVTYAVRPTAYEDTLPVGAPSPRPRSVLRPAWAGALLALLLLVFAGVRSGWINSGWFSSPATLTTAMTAPATQRLALVLPVVAYDAPSRAFIVPTVTPLGRRPILMMQATPPPALTAPITSAALIDQLRERLEQTTEIVETNETEFNRSISFGSVQTASRLPVAPPLMLRPSSSGALVDSTASPQPSPTSEPTPTATPLPLLVQSLDFTNVRSGPGTDFDVMELLEPGADRRVLGRTQNAAWLLIETTNGEGGWVSTAVVDIDGDVGWVEIRD